MDSLIGDTAYSMQSQHGAVCPISRGLDFGPALSAREAEASKHTRPQEDTVRLHIVQGPSIVLPSSQPIIVSHQRPKHQKGSTTTPPPPPARSPSSSIPPNGAFFHGLVGLDWPLTGLIPAPLWCLR
ncbi:hypothetical protein B0H65DRAFT_266149 [Neurospora tetraspora]|uniref:Uncharacterized protein n=1 Tax=Neurospora tetraspora TaxID=94610 RepID=A0AAE0JAT8_9PEZI|nr:hypothetical protein B0H65DRAFT_266149 [Neurospora tetraspora]